MKQSYLHLMSKNVLVSLSGRKSANTHWYTLRTKQIMHCSDEYFHNADYLVYKWFTRNKVKVMQISFWFTYCFSPFINNFHHQVAMKKWRRPQHIQKGHSCHVLPGSSVWPPWTSECLFWRSVSSFEYFALVSTTQQLTSSW